MLIIPSQCYIGKRRLDRAISLYKKTYPSGSGDEFSITWLPYYLDPKASPTGVPLAKVFETKFGAGRAGAMQQRLAQMGTSEGIHFTFGGKIGSTRDSHRLILLAQTKGLAMQDRVVERLFQSYFEQNGDITNRDELKKAGVEAGLDEVEVKGWLESDKGGAQVDQEAKLAKKTIGSGVPHFVIQGDYSVDGAQDPSAFLEIFDQIKSANSY